VKTMAIASIGECLILLYGLQGSFRIVICLSRSHISACIVGIKHCCSKYTIVFTNQLAGGNPTLLRGVPLTWGEGRRLKKVSLSWGTVDFASSTCASGCGSHQTAQYTSIVIILCFCITASTGPPKTTVQFVYDAEGKPFMLRFNGKTDSGCGSHQTAQYTSIVIILCFCITAYLFDALSITVVGVDSMERQTISICIMVLEMLWD